MRIIAIILLWWYKSTCHVMGSVNVSFVSIWSLDTEMQGRGQGSVPGLVFCVSPLICFLWSCYLSNFREASPSVPSYGWPITLLQALMQGVSLSGWHLTSYLHLAWHRGIYISEKCGWNICSTVASEGEPIWEKRGFRSGQNLKGIRGKVALQVTRNL